MKTLLRLLLSHCWGTVHHPWPAEPLAMSAKPVLQSVEFCWVSSERVQRSENWSENYSDPRKFVVETTPMLWMSDKTAIPSWGILDICPWVETCPIYFSENLQILFWNNEPNVQTSKNREYCLITWAQKALFWWKKKIVTIVAIVTIYIVTVKAVVLLKNRTDIP